MRLGLLCACFFCVIIMTQQIWWKSSCLHVVHFVQCYTAFSKCKTIFMNMLLPKGLYLNLLRSLYYSYEQRLDWKLFHLYVALSKMHRVKLIFHGLFFVQKLFQFRYHWNLNGLFLTEFSNSFGLALGKISWKCTDCIYEFFLWNQAHCRKLSLLHNEEK